MTGFVTKHTSASISLTKHTSAGQPTLVYSQTDNGQATSNDFGTSLAVNRGGFRFTAGSTFTASIFKWPVYQRTGGTGTLICKVFAYTSDTEFGALLASSSAVNISSLCDDEAGVCSDFSGIFTLTTPVTFQSGTKYYVVLEGSIATSKVDLKHNSAGAGTNTTIFASAATGFTVSVVGLAGHISWVKMYSLSEFGFLSKNSSTSIFSTRNSATFSNVIKSSFLNVAKIVVATLRKTITENTFSNLRGQASASAALSYLGGTSPTSNDIICRLQAGTTTDKYTIMTRGVLMFDTSVIPSGFVIESARVTLESDGTPASGLGGAIGLTSFTSGSALGVTNTDFAVANFGSTRFASDVNFSDLPLDGSTITLELNAAGLAAINRSGLTKFGVRSSFDIDNSAPTWSSGAKSEFTMRILPTVLTVTYTDSHYITKH